MIKQTPRIAFELMHGKSITIKIQIDLRASDAVRRAEKEPQTPDGLNRSNRTAESGNGHGRWTHFFAHSPPSRRTPRPARFRLEHLQNRRRVMRTHVATPIRTARIVSRDARKHRSASAVECAIDPRNPQPRRDPVDRGAAGP